MATLDNPDVIIEILSRLPPETLLRLKSVCKFWYVLIKSPKFVTKHFLNSLQHEHVFLKRCVTKNYAYRDVICSILKFPPALDQSVFVFDVDLPFPYRYLEISGHSHGLVCLTDHTDILLCNPSTREFRKLPPSILLLEHSGDPDGYHLRPHVVGFGYDTKSRDFKVVRIVSFSELYWKIYPERVEIYDLSKDRWREIGSPVYVGGHIEGMPFFHQGTYYSWVVKEDETQMIQSFDMNEEVFGEISVPKSFQDDWVRCRSMGVWNGSMVLFHYPFKENEKPFDIWEMDIWEMGNNESGCVLWSKLLTIGPISGVQIEKPLCFVSSDELLMEVRESGQLIRYNIKTQQFKELPITGDRDYSEATSFVKSLVSVKGGNNIFYYEF